MHPYDPNPIHPLGLASLATRAPVLVHRHWFVSAWFTALVALLFFSASARAQSATGAITGRVLNEGTGEYIKNAKVRAEGASTESTTNEFGEYHLDDVAPGSRVVRVSYPGLDSKSAAVVVTGGARAELNFSLTSLARYGDKAAPDGVVKLDVFTVASRRETDANIIASNEQRSAVNSKEVIPAGAFGDVTEGNIGEFVKNLPGVTVDYVAADARTINVRGFSGDLTQLAIDGAKIASASSTAFSRAQELEQISLNNVSRIEVIKVPQPDIPAAHLRKESPP